MKNLLLKPVMREAFKNGDKTHTRRLFGLDEINEKPDDWEFPLELDCQPGLWTIRNYKTGAVAAFKPKYHVGEVVFVGEAYCYESDSFAIKPRIRYKAGGIKEAKPEDIPIGVTIYNYLSENYPDCIKWRSPSSMPAWAARTHARITSVGCGRLWDMTEEDAVKEGFGGALAITSGGMIGMGTALYWFAKTWDQINPKYSWAGNYWVFDYGIERVEL